jgi:hypothetical protein
MWASGSIFVRRKAAPARARDADVRALLKEQLAAIHAGTGTLILEELGLCQGNVRVDVAAVNAELAGFEIKSPSDTLARWPNQQQLYSRVVDRAWLVAPIRTIEKAQLPDWWGQIAVFDELDRLALRILRPAAPNPIRDKLSIAKLLWRDEALELLRDAGCARGVMTRSRTVVWRRVAEAVDIDHLRAAVRAALMRRPEMIRLLKSRAKR